MSPITIDIIIIFSFAFIPLVLAEFARKDSMSTLEDFIVYSRDMPLLFAFCTIFATWYSAFAVLGSVNSFYVNGPVYMTAFAWNTLFAVGVFFVGRRIWYYGRKHGYLTPSDFFDDIYGSKPLTLVITMICIVFTLPYLQIQMLGGTYLLEVALNGELPWRITVLIFYVIMVVYMWAGGIRSVALADVFYGAMIMFVVLLTGFFLSQKAGGIRFVFDYLMEHEGNVTVSRDGGNANVLLWLTMFVITPIGALMSPPMWIRHYSIRERASFYKLPLFIALATICYFGSILSGNAARVLKPLQEQTDIILPNLIMTYGGPIMAAILLCGFFAAALSTANSQIHAMSAIVTVDVHKRYINPNASDVKLIHTNKWSLLVISLFTFIIITQRSTVILDAGLVAMSGTAQLIIPAIGALFWKRAKASGALAGLLAGVAVLMGLKMIGGLEASLCGCISLAVNAILYIVIGLYGKPEPDVRERIVNYKAEFDGTIK